MLDALAVRVISHTRHGLVLEYGFESVGEAIVFAMEEHYNDFQKSEIFLRDELVKTIFHINEGSIQPIPLNQKITLL